MLGSASVGCGAQAPAPSPGEPLAATEAAITPSAPARDVSLSIPIPAGASLADLAVVANEIQLDASVSVSNAVGGAATTASTGTAPLRIGRNASLGNVVAGGSVVLSDGAHLHGDLHAAGAISSTPHASWVVDGAMAEREPQSTRALVRHASFATVAPAVRVGPHQAVATNVAPGAYASLDVGPGSEVVLAAGSYYFDSLSLSPGATLRIDDRAGAVFVYVGADLKLLGEIAPIGAGQPRFLLGFLGSSTLPLSRPFAGGLVAPFATIALQSNPTPHRGAFFAAKVHLQEGARVVQAALPWVIGSVRFDRASACAGDTVRVSVDAPDPMVPSAQAALTIDGAPAGTLLDQIVGAPGERLYAVSATAVDGTMESQIARLPVVACAAGQPRRPTLVGSPSPLEPDAVDFTVTNAAELGDGTYEFRFGDGAVVSGTSPAVTHSFLDAIAPGAQRGAFDVTVTFRRAGATDVAAQRTFVVWSGYEMSRARGLLEPPVKTLDHVLRRTAGDFGGTFELTNREADVLTLTRRRVDFSPCDGDAPFAYGADESISLSIAAKSAASVSVALAAGSVPTGACGVSFTTGAPRRRACLPTSACRSPRRASQARASPSTRRPARC
jgi:hypothetical protein